MNVANLLQKTEPYTMEDLLFIMQVLRSPEGCAWDREQTHKSIRRDFLEECYEAVEAIDLANSTMLREELGDVLLNIVFHCRIEQEKNVFGFADVVHDVAAKMIERHPHVFATTKVESTAQILENWDAIKRKTKNQGTNLEALRSVTPALPALMRCQKVLTKAAKYGMAVPQIMHQLEGEPVTSHTIGVLLSQAVLLAQKNGIDAESALASWTATFIEEVK